MKVKLVNLTKHWGKVVGVDSISLEIGDGEFVAFLGPSGCGEDDDVAYGGRHLQADRGHDSF